MRHQLITAAILLLMSACSTSTTSPQPPEETPIPAPSDSVQSLIGSEIWTLSQGTVDGVSLVLLPGKPVTLQLTGTAISGVSACNTYGGDLVEDGGPLFPEIFGTLMACAEPNVMELESAFIGALRRSTDVSLDGESLVLSGEDVQLRFTFGDSAPADGVLGLEDTIWVLMGVVDGDVITSPAAPATLVFERGQIEGTSGCNSFGSFITIEGQVLAVPALEITEIGCAPEIMQQESAIVEVLNGQSAWRIDGDRLIIEKENASLIYRVES